MFLKNFSCLKFEKVCNGRHYNLHSFTNIINNETDFCENVEYFGNYLIVQSFIGECNLFIFFTLDKFCSLKWSLKYRAFSCFFFPFESLYTKAIKFFQSNSSTPIYRIFAINYPVLLYISQFSLLEINVFKTFSNSIFKICVLFFFFFKRKSFCVLCQIVKLFLGKKKFKIMLPTVFFHFFFETN